MNLGIAAAEGELIAKMDDDNLYGEHYLSDLVRAFDYSDAELVGKGAHYAYFEGRNTTMLRLPGLEHRYSFLVQGGTFLGKADMFRSYGFADLDPGRGHPPGPQAEGGRRQDLLRRPVQLRLLAQRRRRHAHLAGRPHQADQERPVLLRGPPRRPRADLSQAAPLRVRPGARSCVRWRRGRGSGPPAAPAPAARRA